MVKTVFGNINSCNEHRKKNNLPILSKKEKEDIECGKECPVANTCKLRNTCRTLQDAFGESEWG